MKLQAVKTIFVPLALTIMLGLALFAIPYGLIPTSQAQEPLDEVGPLPHDVVVTRAVEEPGIVVNTVLKDSPAALAGVKRGDIILQVNGQDVNLPHELQTQLMEIGTGTATLTVLHGDETRTLTATLQNGFLGVELCGGMTTMIEAIKLMPSFPILAVEANSPAAQAGLQAEDIITAIDGQAIDETHTLPDLLQTYHPGDTVMVKYQRGDDLERSTSVVLGQHPDDPAKAYWGVRLPQTYFIEGEGDMHYGIMGPATASDMAWTKIISTTSPLTQSVDFKVQVERVAGSPDIIQVITSEDEVGELY